MKIGFDGRFLFGARRGIGQYSLNLLTALMKVDSDTRFTVYGQYSLPPEDLPISEQLDYRYVPNCGYALWEQLAFPNAATRDGVNLLHFPGNTATVLPNRKRKVVVTVHDIAYLKSTLLVPAPTSIYPKLGRLYRRLVVPKAVCNADYVLTVSKFARKDILLQFKFLNADRVKAIPNGVADYYLSPLKGDAQRLSRIVIVGGRDPQKNVQWAVSTLVGLEPNCLCGWELVVVGVSARDLNGTQSGVKVHYCGYLNQRRLLDIYDSSKILVFPSLYESFGIPLVEAMSRGLLVVSSDRGAAPEIVESAGLFFDPCSRDSLAKAILAAVQGWDDFKDLRDKGVERARLFTWTNTAQQTLNVYRAVCRT